ncbi:unnamed protein product, partial [marine sediment metagenome]
MMIDMNYSDDEKLDYFISFISECTNEHGELKYLIELQNSFNISFKHFLIYLKDLEHWNPFFAENISIDELKTKEIIKKALAFVALDEEYPSEIIAFIPELDISFSSSEKKWHEKKEEVLLIERNFSMEG